MEKHILAVRVGIKARQVDYPYWLQFASVMFRNQKKRRSTQQFIEEELEITAKKCTSVLNIPNREL